MKRLAVRVENAPRLSLVDLVQIAIAAEAAGFESVWVPESGGRDAISLITAFAAATDRIKIATGILPIFSRTPTVTAMSAAGVAGISGNRFVLGLGTGHRKIVENIHGIPYSAPLDRMNETITLIQGLLAGSSVSIEGTHFKVSGARLGRVAASVSVPVYMAALGPKMMSLAGRIADGVLLNWTPADHIPEAVDILKRAAESADRDPALVDSAGYVRTATTEGMSEEKIRRHLREQVAGYANHPYYKRFFVSTGFRREMEESSKALAAGDTEAAVAAISLKMQDQIAVVGTAEACRAEINRRRHLGLTLPVIAPFAVDEDIKGAYLRLIDAFGQSI